MWQAHQASRFIKAKKKECCGKKKSLKFFFRSVLQLYPTHDEKCFQFGSSLSEAQASDEVQLLSDVMQLTFAIM